MKVGKLIGPGDFQTFTTGATRLMTGQVVEASNTAPAPAVNATTKCRNCKSGYSGYGLPSDGVLSRVPYNKQASMISCPAGILVMVSLKKY